MMKKIKALLKNTAFNIFLILLFTLIVLTITLLKDGKTILELLTNIHAGWLYFLIGIMIVDKCLLGYGLAIEVKQSHPEYRYRFGVINAWVAGLFNNITPGASGGQIAQGYIFKKQGIPLATSVGVLWLDFIVYQSTMCLVVAVLLLLRFPYFYTQHSQFFFVVILGFCVGAGIIVFLWLLANSARFYKWLTTSGIWIGHRLHLVKDVDAALRKLNHQLENFAREIVVLRTHKKMIVQLVLINVVRLLIWYSTPIFCAFALGLTIGPDQYLNMIALSAFVAMVNAFLPMPGSSGGTEATFILMFSTIFSVASASAMMILWRLMTFYLTLIIGSMVFLYAKTRKDIPIQESQHHPRTYQSSAYSEE